jgi:hypothetical protein
VITTVVVTGVELGSRIAILGRFLPGVTGVNRYPSHPSHDNFAWSEACLPVTVAVTGGQAL